MITDKQRALRSRGIFSSDAPRIMMGDQVQLWAEKIGRVEPEDIGSRPEVRLGNMMEAAALKGTCSQIDIGNDGLVVASPDTYLAEMDGVTLGAHADGAIRYPDPQREIIIEVKVWNTGSAIMWGKPGTDEIPESVMWQVQHQLLTSGAKAAKVGLVLTSEDNLTNFALGLPVAARVYNVAASAALFDAMLAHYVLFWDRVRSGTPPAWKRRSDMSIIFPESSKSSAVAADAEMLELVERVVSARAICDGLEVTVEQLENKIKAFMGDHEFLTHNGAVVVSWKSGSPRHTFDAKRFTEENESIALKYMVEKPGVRSFLIKPAAKTASTEKGA